MKGADHSQESVGSQFAQQLFAGIYPYYDTLLRVMTLDADRHWKLIAFHKAAVNGGECVVDVAAGTGIFTFKVAEALGPKGSVLGIDATIQMLECAKVKEKKLRLAATASFGCAVAESLPVRDGLVDCWVSCYLMKYCNLAETVSEALRVLKPSGRFVAYDFTVPSGGLFAWLCRLYIFRLMPALSRVLGDTGVAWMLRRLPRVIGRSTWSNEIVEALSNAGFEAIGLTRLTSGVVTLVSARKSRGDPYANSRSLPTVSKIASE